jgi:hypothetical protein
MRNKKNTIQNTAEATRSEMENCMTIYVDMKPLKADKLKTT